MSIIWLIPLAAALELPFAAYIQNKAGRGETGTQEAPEWEAEAPAVYEVLMGVYTELRKAGAWVHRPWIRACMQEITEGRVCPPDVAIKALYHTAGDLYGTRWYDDRMTRVFSSAVEELTGMI